MRLVLLGPPGVGKGTQADLIAREFEIRHYSTGDIFRVILKGSSLLSKKLAKYLNVGEIQISQKPAPFHLLRSSLKEGELPVNLRSIKYSGAL